VRAAWPWADRTLIKAYLCGRCSQYGGQVRAGSAHACAYDSAGCDAGRGGYDCENVIGLKLCVVGWVGGDIGREGVDGVGG
jgi:hypothetical protein